jgi:predicted RND superfamily exporter protein
MSLWFSQIQMLSDFAFLGTCGLIGSLFAVFLLMPAAVSVARWSPTTPAGTAAAITRITPWITRHPRAGLSMAGGAVAILFAFAAAQGFAIPIETDLRVMHPEPNPAMDTTAEIMRRFSGQGDFVPIEVTVDLPGALTAAAHATAAAMASEPCHAVGVLQVSGLHQLLPHPDRIARTRDRFAGSNPSETLSAFQRVVEDSAFSPEAYADYSGVLEQLISPRVAPSVADIVTRAELGSRLFPAASLDQGSPPTTTVLIAHLAKPIVDRSQRREVVEALNRAALSVRDADVTVAGVAAVTLELEDAARAGLPRSAIVSVILVLIWLYLFLRSIRSVLLALLPLVFAVVVIILFIMATGQRLNPINAVALPLLAGIAVDAGLFLLAASPIRSGVDRDIAWRLRATSHAVILATSTTTLAFLAMYPSHTPAIQSLGIVSAVGVTAAGFGAIALLMPLLVTWAPAHLLAERSVE